MRNCTMCKLSGTSFVSLYIWCLDRGVSIMWPISQRETLPFLLIFIPFPGSYHWWYVSLDFQKQYMQIRHILLLFKYADYNEKKQIHGACVLQFFVVNNSCPTRDMSWAVQKSFYTKLFIVFVHLTKKLNIKHAERTKGLCLSNFISFMMADYNLFLW